MKRSRNARARAAVAADDTARRIGLMNAGTLATAIAALFLILLLTSP